MTNEKTNLAAEKELKKLRNEINRQDKILLQTLKKRFQVVKKVALLKKKHDMPVLQKSRWKTIIEDRVKLGVSYKIAPAFTIALIKLIHKESVRFQKELQHKKGKKNE
jgi:chorismate mutase